MHPRQKQYITQILWAFVDDRQLHISRFKGGPKTAGCLIRYEKRLEQRAKDIKMGGGPEWKKGVEEKQGEESVQHSHHPICGFYSRSNFADICCHSRNCTVQDRAEVHFLFVRNVNPEVKDPSRY